MNNVKSLLLSSSLLCHLCKEIVVVSGADYNIPFNYNPSSPLGPNNWGAIDTSDSEYNAYITSPEGNQCDEMDDQSPVDIRPTSTCMNDHQFWNNRGTYNFDTLDFQILPHSLRVNLKVPTDEEEMMDNAARADFSNLSDWVPAIHVDVKIGSEHYLNGVQYAAEMQITHAWKDRDSFIMVSILMDTSQNTPNPRLEEFIREWDESSRRQRYHCLQNRNPSSYPHAYQRKYPRRSERDMELIWGDHEEFPGKADWDVYGFLPTPWYCGYKGSLTVPPCQSEVNWRVADLPLNISEEQLARMTDLLLQRQRLDADCNYVRNTAAFEGGVNRPLQNWEGRTRVWCCTRENWEAKHRWEYYGGFPENYDAWKPKRDLPPVLY